nr:EOG090X0LXA [Lepidurus arcticus]
MNSNVPVDKLQALDAIEKDVAASIQSASQALTELSKDKPVMKQVEMHTNQFLKTLSHVENELSKHINYLTQVSTGQPHEGSAYAAQKMWKMSLHRLDHARTRLQELENMKNRAIVNRVVTVPILQAPTPGPL